MSLSKYWNQYHNDEINSPRRHDDAKRWFERTFGAPSPVDSAMWQSEHEQQLGSNTKLTKTQLGQSFDAKCDYR